MGRGLRGRGVCEAREDGRAGRKTGRQAGRQPDGQAERLTPGGTWSSMAVGVGVGVGVRTCVGARVRACVRACACVRAPPSGRALGWDAVCYSCARARACACVRVRDGRARTRVGAPRAGRWGGTWSTTAPGGRGGRTSTSTCLARCSSPERPVREQWLLMMTMMILSMMAMFGMTTAGCASPERPVRVGNGF